jgi:hypothetical protein
MQRVVSWRKLSCIETHAVGSGPPRNCLGNGNGRDSDQTKPTEEPGSIPGITALI